MDMNQTLSSNGQKSEPSAEKRNHDRILALAISLLKSPKQCANPEEISKILDEICLIFPSNKAILDDPEHAHGGKDHFAFLKSLDRPALRELLHQEEPSKIALISFFFTRSEMAKLIAVLDPPMIVEILLQMGKISKLSFHSIKHTATSFSGALKTRSITLHARATQPKVPTPPPFRGKPLASPTPTPVVRKTLPTPPPVAVRKRESSPFYSRDWRETPAPQDPDENDFEMVRILS